MENIPADGLQRKKSIYNKKVLYIYIYKKLTPPLTTWVGRCLSGRKGYVIMIFLQDGKRDQLKLTFTTKTGRATAGPWNRIFLFSDLFYDAFLT